MKRLVALAAVSALFLVGCGSGDSDDIDPLAGGPTTMHDMAGGTDHAGNATASCSPSGTTLTIAANGTKFDKDCLAAPAGQAFKINYDNKDQVTHNIQILASHSASEAMFDGGLIPNGVKSLDVPALKAGTYAFHCKIHPGQMSGTFVVA
ncbi:MAG: cupredoxin domain-containing protein [Acidimicrobiales bacterium]